MSFKEKSQTDKHEDCLTLEVLLKICRGPKNRHIFPFNTIRLDERHLDVLEELGYIELFNKTKNSKVYEVTEKGLELYYTIMEPFDKAISDEYEVEVGENAID